MTGLGLWFKGRLFKQYAGMVVNANLAYFGSALLPALSDAVGIRSPADLL